MGVKKLRNKDRVGRKRIGDAVLKALSQYKHKKEDGADGSRMGWQMRAGVFTIPRFWGARMTNGVTFSTPNRCILGRRTGRKSDFPTK